MWKMETLFLLQWEWPNRKEFCNEREKHDHHIDDVPVEVGVG